MSDITLRNHRGELARLGTELERFGEAHHLTSDDVCMINLVLDEIVANVIRHAHDDGGEHDIAIRLALDGRKLTIEVADDGMRDRATLKGHPDQVFLGPLDPFGDGGGNLPCLPHPEPHMAL